MLTQWKQCCMKDDLGERCNRAAVYEVRLPMVGLHGNSVFRLRHGDGRGRTIPVALYVCNECRERCADVMSCCTADPVLYRRLLLESMTALSVGR